MSRLRRLTNLWRRRALDTEFDEELRFHFDARVEANLRTGMPQAQAEREARRHVGSCLRAKEGMREARVMTGLETVLRDVMYGARLLWRQPGATVLAILTLSLGIGANAAIFSLLHAVLLRPLPFPEPDRLAAIVDNFREGQTNAPPTVPELLDLRASSRHLDGISFGDVRDVQIGGGNEPVRAVAARVDSSFLPTLGVQAAIGRLFAPDDHAPGSERVVVLSDGIWRRNFGGDPAVANRRIVVNSVPHRIAGVLPDHFSFDYFSSEPIELYVPFPLDASYASRAGEFANVRRVTAIARLKPDVTWPQAVAEVEAFSQQLRTDHAQLYRRGSDGQDLGFVMTMTPLQDIVGGRARSVVVLLFGAVGLVLLIACVNTAQFLLARAIERRHEVTIRMALGAGRSRLIRQFLTEAALLALIAAAVGLLQAVWLMDLLGTMLSIRAPFVADLRINTAVLGFTATVAVLVTLACGLFPAMHAARTAMVSQVSRTTGAGRSRTYHALITMEVAVSVVLVVCAGLLVENLRQLQDAPRGYSAEQVTVMRMRMSGRVGSTGTGIQYQQYLQQIAAVPGIDRAAVADAPLQGFPGVEFAIVGREDDAATLSRQRAGWRIVSPEYFSLLRIPILAGRAFSDDDSAARPPVAIINHEMARRFWPDQSPVGRQIRSGAGPRSTVATIVGVAGDVRPLLSRDVDSQIYVSYLQQSEPNIRLLVRPTPGVEVSVDAVKQAIWSVAPDQPVFDIRPMVDAVDRSIAEPRVITRLLGSLAILAVLMSTLGIYTVVSYLTARRTKEVALRRAIGAGPLDVLRLLGMPTMIWTFAGLTLGILAALAAGDVLRSVVLGSAQVDIATVGVTALLYVVAVSIAVAVPAARALRIQPADALRSE